MVKQTRRNMVKGGIAAATVATLFTPFIARGATRKFRLGHSNAIESGPNIASLAFKKFLAEKSEGRLDVDIFPLAQIGNDLAMTKAVAEGTLEATVVGAGSLSDYSLEYSLIELPYLYNSLEAARKSMDGKLAEYLASTVKEKGILTLALAESGFRDITANKPIHTPADLKGLKMRVPPSKILLTTFNALGAQAAAIPFGALDEALRTGTVEATENSISFVVGNEFLMKRQTHLSLTHHVYSPAPFLFSADAFDELSPADKAIVTEGGNIFKKATRDFADAAGVKGLDKIKANGMTVVTDVDIAAFQKAMEGLADKFAAVLPPDSITKIRSLAAV